MPGAFCCLKAAMNTFDMDLEADCALGGIADVRHERLPLRLALRSDVANIVDALLTLRALQALDHGAGCYPAYRRVRSASRRPVEELFDDLALRSGIGAPRPAEAS